jgi:uncharacterized membrane protein YadS
MSESVADGAITEPRRLDTVPVVEYAVDNTAETTATGAIYGSKAQDIAVLVKSTRNALIGFVVLGFALYWARRGEAADVAPGIAERARFVWSKFPKFVLGYIAVSALATWGAFSKADITSLGNLSKWAFLLTFAGVGLNTDFRAFAKSGLRPPTDSATEKDPRHPSLHRNVRQRMKTANAE